MKVTVPIAAVRALNNALIRNPRLAAHAEATKYDRLVDGGEWSDAFHAEAMCQIQDEVGRRVACAYGVADCDLWHEHAVWTHTTLERSWRTWK